MKVDMDGKNCNLPSEHTPLGQTNTEKAAKEAGVCRLS